MSQIQVEYVQHMGTDLAIVNAARVSYGKEKKQLDDKDKKLLRYLAKHKHYTPYEHTSLTVKITCPLYIRSQIMRHRTASYNEISRRYTAENITFYEPTQYRKQHSTSKQCSDGELSSEDSTKASIKVQMIHKQCLDTYNELLDLGVSREMARGVLPQNMVTSFYMTANLRNFVHFLKLRLDEHAQEEARVVAEQVRDIILDKFPYAGKCLLEDE